jgi:hypothetical protein
MADVKETLQNDALTQVIYIPPGLTGLSQPMDVAVMSPFKRYVRDIYVKHHIDNEFCRTPSERRTLTSRFVNEAWDKVSSKTIRNGFLKEGLVNIGPRLNDGSFPLHEPNNDE